MSSRMIYTQEMLDFIQDKYRTMPVRDIVPLFNSRFSQDKTHGQIRAAIHRNGIKCDRRTRFQPITAFTPEQIEYIKENYVNHSLADLLPMVNKKFNLKKNIRQLRAFINNHGITSGRTGRFDKGITPWNKGKTGYMGPNETSFKKGNRPHNTKHLHYERIGKDGIIEISVAETNKHTGFHRRFRSKHSWLWEQANGPIPEGHVVIFKDGDRANITLENLVLVTRAELLFANIHGYRGAPNEIKPSIMALAKMEIAGGFRTVGTHGR